MQFWTDEFEGKEVDGEPRGLGQSDSRHYHQQHWLYRPPLRSNREDYKGEQPLYWPIFCAIFIHSPEGALKFEKTIGFAAIRKKLWIMFVITQLAENVSKARVMITLPRQPGLFFKAIRLQAKLCQSFIQHFFKNW